MKQMPKIFLKFFLWMALIVVIIITALSVYVYFTAQSYLNKNLSELVAKQTNNQYNFDFKTIELDISNFSLKIIGAELKPNIEEAKKQKSNAPEKVFYSFESQEIQLKNIRIKELIKNKNFLCSNLTIVSPSLELTGQKILQKDSTNTLDLFFHELKPLFNTKLKKIQIDEIDFINANYDFYSLVGDSSKISRARNLSISIKDFTTDSAMIFNSAKLFNTEDILINMNNFETDMGDSLHVTKIDTLSYSLKSSDIWARGFHLIYKNADHTKSLYDVTVPDIYLKSKSVTSLNINDSIKIRYLEFNNAQIKFYQKKGSKELDIKDINNFDLYSLIKNQFFLIDVDSFYIKNAELQIFQNTDYTNYQQHFGNININLHDFRLDSLSNKNTGKLLHAEDLQMAITDYHLRLDDNEHEFIADSLMVSTTSNQLTAKGITIQPIEPQNANSRIDLNITCNTVSIENVNLKKLYHTRTLPTNKVEITQPIVSIQYRSDIKQKKKKDKAGLLFNLITAYLKGVYSNVVYIEKGQLKIQNLSNGRIQGFFETDFTFSLTDFSLDSTSLTNTDKFFYATNFSLDFSKYHMKLVDNLHQLSADSISISSHEVNAKIFGFHLRPVISNVTEEVLQQYNRSELYNIYIPKISLFQTNLHKAFFWKELKIARFTIENPVIYYESFTGLKENSNRLNSSEFYQLVFNYLDDISVQKLEIPDGTLTWVNHSKKGKTITVNNKFSSELLNFRFNESEIGKQKLFFSENFNFSLKNQLFKLSDNVHLLQAGQIDVSSQQKMVRFKNAVLYPDITSPDYLKLPTTFQISVPELKFSGIDIKEAYYSKHLKVSDIYINSPKFEVYSQKGKTKTLEFKGLNIPLPKTINSIAVNNIHLTGGNVIAYRTEPNKKTQYSSFLLDFEASDIALKNKEQKPKTNFYTKKITTKISDFQLILDNKSHIINIDRLFYDKIGGKINIEGFNVKPTLIDTSKNLFNISVPSLSFSGFDTDLAFQENNYYFNTIHVDAPKIGLQLRSTNNNLEIKNLEKIELYKYLEPYLDELKIKNLELKNASLSVITNQKKLNHDNINITFNNIEASSTIYKNRLLNSENINVTTFNLIKHSKNELYTFSIDTLNYTTRSKTIRLGNINITPKYPLNQFARQIGKQVDVSEGKISYILMRDVDIEKLIKNKILEAKEVVLGPTDLTIFRNKRFVFDQNQKPILPNDLLFSIHESFVFDSIILLPSTINYSELLETSDEPAKISFTNVKLNMGQVTNIRKLIQSNQKLKISAFSNVFKVGELNATFIFDMNDPDFSHQVTGSLQPMPLTLLNGLIEKNAMISVQHGQLNRFDFDFRANTHEANGHLYFDYDNFKVAMLQYKNDNIKVSKFNSFLANNLVVQSKNPRGKIFEPETIFYKRETNRSVLNFWWKSIYSGAKKAAGIKEKEPSK